MAIPSSGFEVILTQKHGEIEVPTFVDHFFSSELDFYEKKGERFIEVRENIELAVTFRCENSSSRLYMDGLDSLSDRLLTFDPLEGEVFLGPSNKPVTLFANNDSFYPLIPGFYRMAVEHEGQRSYAWLKIVPKQLEEAQWEVMKNEVEKELKGLAREAMLKKTGIKTRYEGISELLIGQFMVIQNRFPAVMAALSDLYHKINYKISKE